MSRASKRERGHASFRAVRATRVRHSLTDLVVLPDTAALLRAPPFPRVVFRRRSFKLPVVDAAVARTVHEQETPTVCPTHNLISPLTSTPCRWTANRLLNSLC